MPWTALDIPPVIVSEINLWIYSAFPLDTYSYFFSRDSFRKSFANCFRNFCRISSKNFIRFKSPIQILPRTVSKKSFKCFSESEFRNGPMDFHRVSDVSSIPCSGNPTGNLSRDTLRKYFPSEIQGYFY